ncbi:MAG TPA: M48 family metallopeptidase [Terriglobia bacterium]|nr:M48 family metallopeptidase [Terriglobia bacterium]
MEKVRAITSYMLLLAAAVAPPLSAQSKKDNLNDIGHRKVASWSLVSMKEEEEIGSTYARQLDRTLKLVHDAVVNEYVNRVAQNLALNSDAKFPISVRVVDNPNVNAMTLPGGYIFVNSGTILDSSNEAQLAAVLAHEIGHVSERSWASNLTKREISSYAMLPLMFTPMSIGTYYLMNGVMASGLPIAFLKFSRNQEEGADFLGVQYLWKAGYDPNAMVTMFGNVLSEERRSPGSVSQLFMDHPPTPDRIIKVEEEIKSLPKRPQYLLNTSEFTNVQRRLRTELRALRHPGQSNRPTLERRQAPDTPPLPWGNGSGKGASTGDQPPVLGHPG